MKHLSFAMFIATLACVTQCEAAPVCLLGTIPCFVDCHNPPALATASEAGKWLRQKRYDTLTRLDRWSALLTTPLVKCLGLNGWKKYKFRVWAIGTVENAATSWDGLRTVDVRIEDFSAGTPGDVTVVPRYIRAEVIRSVWKHLQHRPCRGDRVRIEGELHWDGHGFLEIHPTRVGEVGYLDH